eukprot:2883381-Pyramimonas_sp.AAC.1
MPPSAAKRGAAQADQRTCVARQQWQPQMAEKAIPLLGKTCRVASHHCKGQQQTRPGRGSVRRPGARNTQAC